MRRRRFVPIYVGSLRSAKQVVSLQNWQNRCGLILDGVGMSGSRNLLMIQQHVVARRRHSVSMLWLHVWAGLLRQDAITRSPAWV